MTSPPERVRRVSRLPLRVRLVVGFSVAMILVLTAAGGFVYWRVQFALDRGLDSELDQAAETIAPLVGQTGQVTGSGERAADATGVPWQVLDSTGAVLDRGRTAPVAPLVPVSRLPSSGSTVVDVGGFLPAGARPYRVHLSALDAPARGTLLVGLRRDRRDEALRELLLQLLLAGLGALLVTALVGERLSRAALRPVETYRRRAAEIAGGAARLRLEVPTDRDDEVTRLGHTLNDMLAAQEHALERERRFVQEASHELRTPLTLLRSRIQLTRRRERPTAELEAALDELLVDVERLADLADHLLDLGVLESAPLDAARPAAETEAVSVVEAAVGRLSRDVDGRAAITTELPQEGITVPVSEQALARAVTNLVGNALLHGAPPIAVRVRRHHGWVAIEVSDEGEGMSEELLRVAPQRFARADEARSRPGAGLGLSLVEQLAAGAGGELRLCAHGSHVSHPVATPVVCEHPEASTATLVLPTADQR